MVQFSTSIQQTDGAIVTRLEKKSSSPSSVDSSAPDAAGSGELPVRSPVAIAQRHGCHGAGREPQRRLLPEALRRGAAVQCGHVRK